MKGAVYEKKITVSHDHEFQVVKESMLLHWLKVTLSGTAITLGRGGKCTYPLTTGNSLILRHVDASTLYIKGDGNAEVIYLIGTVE